MNLCPESVSEDPKDQEVLMSTVKHEILHALGFSAGLYAFFRDEHGRPRSAQPALIPSPSTQADGVRLIGRRGTSTGSR